DNSLFPNQFVNIQLLVNTLKDQTVIPNSAVRRGAPNGVATTFVYVVNQDHSVAVRPVTLGVVDGERVAGLSGLKPGGLVVTEGADRLREGATVTLPGAAGPNAPATPGANARGKMHPGAAGADAQGRRHQRGQRPPQSS